MAEEEYGKGVPTILNPQMGYIEATVEDIRYRAQLIARNQKLDSGVATTGVTGFIAGFIFILIVAVVLPIMIWGAL